MSAWGGSGVVSTGYGWCRWLVRMGVACAWGALGEQEKEKVRVMRREENKIAVSIKGLTQMENTTIDFTRSEPSFCEN
jgi:Fe-S cluster assembly iron-binding protein IscA